MCSFQLGSDGSIGLRRVVAVLRMVLWSGTALVLGANAQGQELIDSRLPKYAFDAKGISGKIQSIGSDSMQGLMLRWAARFREGYPSVQFELEGAGSSKAIPGLIAGADLGPMSRDLRSSEIRDFETRYNYPPTIIPTAMDLVIVVVHRDNPIASLTLPELDAIFSSTRKSGARRSIRSWGEIGGREEYRQASIVAYGRNAASGTYGFFKESVMGGGDFKDSVSEQPGATSVVQAVGTNRFAIGYSGTGHKTESVRIVPWPLASRPRRCCQPARWSPIASIRWLAICTFALTSIRERAKETLLSESLSDSSIVAKVRKSYNKKVIIRSTKRKLPVGCGKWDGNRKTEIDPSVTCLSMIAHLTIRNRPLDQT